MYYIFTIWNSVWCQSSSKVQLHWCRAAMSKGQKNSLEDHISQDLWTLWLEYACFLPGKFVIKWVLQLGQHTLEKCCIIHDPAHWQLRLSIGQSINVVDYRNLSFHKTWLSKFKFKKKLDKKSFWPQPWSHS